MPRSVSRLRQETVPLADMLDSWARSLASDNKSPLTIRSYTDSLRALIRELGGAAHTGITADDIRGFLAAELERKSPASVGVYYRSLKVFFGWLAEEEPSLMPVSPMKAIRHPKVPARHKPPLSEDQLRALLATVAGDGFEDRRDNAILRILIDTGMRVSGLAGLRLLYTDRRTGGEKTDVHLGRRRLVITLKGADETEVPVGRKTSAAIDRYLRARLRHPERESTWLWLGVRGHDQAHFGTTGIRLMVGRRGDQAGIPGVHPHQFRRTFSHDWLHAGGTENDLMKITGWKTRAMIEVYAGELAGERARDAHARLSPGDRL
jgi:site-specific recombinase XerD